MFRWLILFTLVMVFHVTRPQRIRLIYPSGRVDHIESVNQFINISTKGMGTLIGDNKELAEWALGRLEKIVQTYPALNGGRNGPGQSDEMVDEYLDFLSDLYAKKGIRMVKLISGY